MKKFSRPAALSIAILFSVALASCSGSSGTPSSASSDSRNGTYMVCYTESNAHGVTVSSAFRIPSADQVTMLEEPWAKDFRRYVGQSGDEGGISVSCTPVDPKNPDAALKNTTDAWQKQGVPVKKVSWKYAGG